MSVNHNHQQLLITNAELATELRLVKEQLGQANMATQHLALLLASTPSDDAMKVLQRKYDDALSEIKRLKAALRRAQRMPRARIEEDDESHEMESDVETAKASKAGRVRGKRPAAAMDDDGDLMSFGQSRQATKCGKAARVSSNSTISLMDADENQMNLIKHSGPFEPHPTDLDALLEAEAAENLISLSAEDANLRREPASVPIPPPKREPSLGIGVANMPVVNGPDGRPLGFEVTQSDGTVVFVPTPAAVPGNYGARSPHPFLDHEHRRMAGQAVFLEDMEEEDKQLTFVKWSQLYPNHTAIEYQKYYEGVIEPEHVAKMKKREPEQVVQNASSESPSSNTTMDTVQSLTPTTDLTTDTAGSDEMTDIASDVAERASVASWTGSSASVPIFEADSAAEFPTSAATPAVVKDAKEDQEVVATPTQNDSVEDALPQSDSVPSSTAKSTEAIDEKETGELLATSQTNTTLEDAYRQRFSEEPSSPQPVLVQNGRTTTRGGDNRRSPRERNSGRPGTNFRGPRSPTEIEHLFARGNVEDPDTFRTVCISNVAPNIQLSEVLASVCGGKVLSTVYMDMAGMRTEPCLKTNAVLVVFVKGIEARQFVEFAEKTKTSYWSEFWNTACKPVVKLVDTPSRLVSSFELQDIHTFKQSRMLFLQNGPSWMTSQRVIETLGRSRTETKLPLTVEHEEDGTMLLEFGSIAEARAALKAVDGNNIFFKDAGRGYGKDPCDRPVGEKQRAGEQQTQHENDDETREAAGETGSEGKANKELGDKIEGPVENVEVTGCMDKATE